MKQTRAALIASAAPVAVFATLLVVSVVGLQRLGQAGMLDGYTARVADAAVLLLRMVRIDAGTTGPRILIDNAAGVDVRWPCSGLTLAAPVVAFLLAFPGPPRRRLLGATVAFLGIQAANVARVAVLAYLSRRAPQYLALSHDTVWNALVVAAVLVLWIIWSARAEPSLDTAPDAARRRRSP